MKNLLLFLVILLPITLFAQEQLFFSFSASPTYSYRSISSTNKHEIWRDVTKEMNDRESAKFGYKIKGEVGLELKNNITISGGVAFLHLGEKTQSARSTYDFDGLIVPHKKEGRETYSYRYNYLSIPLAVNYYFLDKTFKYGPFISINTDYLMSKNFSNDKTQEADSKFSYFDYNTFSVSVGIGANLEYKISQSVSFRFSPSYNRSLTSNATFKTDISEYFIPGDTKFRQYNFYVAADLGIKVKLFE